MGNTKELKLTPTQQEVVNLMAEGWKLRYTRGIGSQRGWCNLVNGGCSRRVRYGLHEQLETLGVAKRTFQDWRSKEFALTPFGESLVTKPEPTALEVWWKVTTINTDIERVVCEVSTAGVVLLGGGRKEKKATSWYSYHQTREEAVAAIQQRLERAVRSAESDLKYAKQQLKEFTTTPSTEGEE